MRLAVPVVLAVGCGGGPAPEPVKPVDTTPKKVTRVPIEDDSDNEAPEDGVTFVKTKGTMRKEAIEAGLAPHSSALAECYTGRVGKRRWLGGHVVLQWNIRADGTLSSVKLTESNLGAWAVEQCLLDIAWSAKFARPTGGDAEFTVPLDFSARGGTAIWDEDQALRAVGGQLAILDDCDDFEFDPRGKKGAKKAPARPKPAADGERAERPERPPSNVTITLYVGPAGKLQSVGFASATSEVGQRWAACAEQAAQTWRLPDPRGQIAKAAVRYRPEGD
jgi:TonB family protein